MKKIILFLLCLISLPAFAGFKTLDQTPGPQGNYNQITIFNYTNTDIAYLMNGKIGGAVYGIPQGEADTYHSGMGDERATFWIGTCHHMVPNRFGYACDSHENLNQCTSGYYNADQIKTITIHSPSSCTITCRDGNNCKLRD
jgi:hypothetical protein